MYTNPVLDVRLGELVQNLQSRRIDGFDLSRRSARTEYTGRSYSRRPYAESGPWLIRDEARRKDATFAGRTAPAEHVRLKCPFSLHGGPTLRSRSFSWPVLAKLRFSLMRTTSWHQCQRSCLRRKEPPRLATPGISSLASSSSSIGTHSFVLGNRPMILIRV